MTAFTETQQYSMTFDAIVLFVFLSFVCIIWRFFDWGTSKQFTQTKGLTDGTFLSRINKKVLFILSLSPFALLIVYFMTAKLETRIDEHGVHYKMFPAEWTERSITWDEVSSIEVREHVAYPRRYSSYDVYSLSDEYGLCIFLRNGTKMIIGTKKPGEAKHALWQYRK